MNILYIEDDECDVELLTLSIESYKPSFSAILDVAFCIEEAKPLLQQHKYDIILTDWNMPGSEGEEVIQYLRAMDKAVPIIILSGLISDMHFNIAAQYNAVYCLEKSHNDAFIAQILEIHKSWNKHNQ